jgi:putative ABC transport system permease protein
MTAFLPARAHTPHGPARSSPIRRRVVGVGVATALVAVGLAWPDRVELTHATIAGQETPSGRGSLPTARPTESDSVLLAGVGGVVGVAMGSAITWFYADSRGWRFAVPMTGLLGGVAAALAVGALAGLYPAVRTSRLAPAEPFRAQ